MIVTSNPACNQTQFVRNATLASNKVYVKKLFVFTNFKYFCILSKRRHDQFLSAIKHQKWCVIKRRYVAISNVAKFMIFNISILI